MEDSATHQLPAHEMLLIATCRTGPESRLDVALEAGTYKLWLVDPDSDPDPSSGSLPDAGGDSWRERRKPSRVKELPAGDVVVVIHGFNATASTGIETAANVRDALVAWGLPVTDPEQPDLQEPGAVHVIGFTWPCEHTYFPGYMHDKATVARYAEFSLANLLLDLRAADRVSDPPAGEQAGPSRRRRIHVVAHSMGCFLLIKALNMLAVLHHMPVELPVVDQVIFFAADLNADALEESTITVAQMEQAVLPDFEARATGWHRVGHFPRLWRFIRAVPHATRRPRPVPLERTATGAVVLAEPGAAKAGGAGGTQAYDDRPLNGYGYAALDAIDALRSYSSVHDPALLASPTANRTTEEAGAASGLIRLGWCGPLHPALTMARRHGHRPHRLELVDCSAIVSTHGAYFYDPRVQRDMTACLFKHQFPPSLPSETWKVEPPGELERVYVWHEHFGLQFPTPPASRQHKADESFLAAHKVELGFYQMGKIVAQPGGTVTLPRWGKRGAPRETPPAGVVSLLLKVWQGPVGRKGVWLIRWYYRV